MRKRVRLLGCLCALALVAGACGRGDDSAETSETTVGPATTSAATTAAPATTAGGATTAPGATAPATTEAVTTTTEADVCASEPLQATEVGVTATEITIEVSADVGSSLAPGLFQGNHDAIEGFADYVNANGGIGCRKLVVRLWDSKIDPTEAKNGIIDACQSAVAMVGSNTLFNPDMSPMVGCLDSAGQPTGLPDLAALANDVNQLCNPTTFVIQVVAEPCPIPVGSERTINVVIGPVRYLLSVEPDLHGVFMVPGDLPTTRQSAISNIESQRAEGVVWDATPLVSGRAEQPAYTPFVQTIKEMGSTYVYDGSNDTAMVRMRKEAAAQGVDTVKVWGCSLACYSRNLLEQGGSDVEGTYVWMQFLPFEEADTNAELQAYVDAVGVDNVDSFGAQAWQAAVAFKQVVDEIVATNGPNAITRAAILEGMANLQDFDANGWAGAKSLRGISPCFVQLQVQNGEFVRVHPEERGTLDCDPANVTSVTVEPISAAAALG